MDVVLERIGGFGGMRQRLEVDLDEGALGVSDRFSGSSERALTPEESTELQRLVAAARGATVPPVTSLPGPDAFELRLYLHDEERPVLTLQTVEQPVETGVPGPWGALLAFVDRVLTRELDERPASRQ